MHIQIIKPFRGHCNLGFGLKEIAGYYFWKTRAKTPIRLLTTSPSATLSQEPDESQIDSVIDWSSTLLRMASKAILALNDGLYCRLLLPIEKPLFEHEKIALMSD